MITGTRTHEFRERLKFSETASDEPFWVAVYKKAFPNFLNCMPGLGKTESQRLGIDRVILLTNGKTLRVEEKKREEIYPDILLEYISVDTTGAPGWMEKDLFIDYLAYAFMPNKKVYLFPWDILRRAWLHYKTDWLKSYPIIKAKNIGYFTLSVAVPIGVLQLAVKTASIIQP